MPVHNWCFRASCGQFLTTFLGFMTERASFAAKMRKQVITVRHRLDALLFVFVVRHLMCCGDVEMNTGPMEDNLAQHPQSGDLQDSTPDGPNQVQSDSGTPRKCTADTSGSPDVATLSSPSSSIP